MLIMLYLMLMWLMMCRFGIWFMMLVVICVYCMIRFLVFVLRMVRLLMFLDVVCLVWSLVCWRVFLMMVFGRL